MRGATGSTPMTRSTTADGTRPLLPMASKKGWKSWQQRSLMQGLTLPEDNNEISDLPFPDIDKFLCYRTRSTRKQRTHRQVFPDGNHSDSGKNPVFDTHRSSG